VADASAGPYMQVCISLQCTPPFKFFTGPVPFLPPNRQRQSTERQFFTLLLYFICRPELLRQLQAVSERGDVQQQRPGQLHVPLSAWIRRQQLPDDYRRLHARALPKRRNMLGRSLTPIAVFFLSRDAMLARYLLSSYVRLSVRDPQGGICSCPVSSITKGPPQKQ